MPSVVWRALIAIALTAATANAGEAAPAGRAPPEVIFIWYADGGPAPTASACAGKIPPGYACSFGTDVDDCKRQVQSYLDRWYADLNVVFTYTRPASGRYYTVVVTSDGGAWCNPSYDQRVGGVAPISCEHVLDDGTCYAFQCGHDAKACATIIAQEQAHLVGLEHTSSHSDAMYVFVSALSDGFENTENPIANSVCNRLTQNSFQEMRQRLGEWPGGTKPDPFVDVVQGTLPVVTVYPGELQGSAYGCSVADGVRAKGSGFLALIAGLTFLRRRARRTIFPRR
jgi:hypothetical protein